MKIRLTFASLLMVAAMLWVPSGTTAQSKDGCSRGMELLAGAYRSIGTLTAAFKQTLDAKALNQHETETGRLFLSLDGRMRWQYDKPQGKLAVSDGRKSYLYIPEERQLFVQPLDTGSKAPITLRLLLGKVDVKKEFSCGGASVSGDDVTLKLSLTEPLAGVQDLEVRLNGKTGLVDRVSYKDALGNEVALELSDIKTGQPLEPSLFHFEPPKGVDVIQGGSY